MFISEWLAEAASGPGALRFVIQPMIALLLAVRDGTRDARVGAKPFFDRLFYGTGERRALLRSAWQTLALPLVIAFVLDSILQVVITGSYRPRGSLIVGVLLVGLPYSLVRGLSCRLAAIARRRHRPA